MLESLTLKPEPAQWPTSPLVRARSLFGRDLSDWVATTRSELFGSTPEFVIATGHQAEVWHPGILAKYLALDAFAEASRADLRVELIVDQDPGDPLQLRAPLFESSVGSRLVRETIYLHDAPAEHERLCTGTRRPVTARPPDAATRGRLSLDEVRAGCLAIVEAFNDAQNESTLALQAARATLQLRQRLGLSESRKSPRSFLTASQLTRTTLWHELLERLMTDPLEAARSYNRAVESSPGAGVALLDIRGDEIELPLWRVPPDRPRERFTTAHFDDLRNGSISREEIWPRGLLMTGFMRLVVADLMIHGLGGETYDRITEQWMRDWIGVELAPFVVVSATLLLDFDYDPATEADLAQATWWAHHLPHNLDRFLNEPEAREEKRRLLHAIEEAPRGSQERAAHFQALTSLRRELQARHRSTTQHAVEIRREIQRGFDERTILSDRTWPFAFYKERSLHELATAIRGRFTTPPARDSFAVTG
ncbi:MAG: hypothetical protein ACF8PN_17155 [Phycisphaerales bacterium]